MCSQSFIKTSRSTSVFSVSDDIFKATTQLWFLYPIPLVFSLFRASPPGFFLRIWLNAVFVVNETFICAVRAKAWRKRWNITGNIHSKDIFKDVLMKTNVARGYFIFVNVLGIFYTNFTNLITFYAKQERV